MIYKNIVLIFIFIILTVACDNSPEQDAPEVISREKIDFGAISNHGIFDSSLTFDDSSGRLWMSYSGVDSSALWPSQNIHAVKTLLAYSDNNGASWVNEGTVLNNFTDVTLSAVAPNNAGTWQHEVSKIIYDAAAPANERWKVFWHHYLVVNNVRLFVQHGWIGYKQASTPQGLSAATEIKLFAGSSYHAINNTQGNVTTQSPLGGLPAIQLDTIHADLNSCLLFTEPAVLISANKLHLALQCSSGGSDHKIVLLNCNLPCDVSNGASWNYVGTALTESNAVNNGYLYFAAPQLFQKDNNTYLMVSPVTNNPISGSYNNCLVFQFDGLSNGELVGGVLPSIIKTISGTSNTFNGACSYNENASSSGFILGEITSDFSEFQLFMTKESL